MLPEVRDSAARLGVTDPARFLGRAIPISGVAGDQQAALFGQACVALGMSKNTYGTGSFVLVNVGSEPTPPGHGLLTTVAWRIGGGDTFDLGGSIFVPGAGIKLLLDRAVLIREAAVGEGLLDGIEAVSGAWRPGGRFEPATPGERPQEQYDAWLDAVRRVR